MPRNRETEFSSLLDPSLAGLNPAGDESRRQPPGLSSAMMGAYNRSVHTENPSNDVCLAGA